MSYLEFKYYYKCSVKSVINYNLYNEIIDAKTKINFLKNKLQI